MINQLLITNCDKRLIIDLIDDYIIENQPEMEAIIKGEVSWKTDEGEESVFIMGGIPVKKTKIDRYLKRKRKPDAVMDERDHAGGKTLLCKFQLSLITI